MQTTKTRTSLIPPPCKHKYSYILNCIMLGKCQESRKSSRFVNENSSKEQFLLLLRKRTKTLPKISSDGLTGQFAKRGWRTQSSVFKLSPQKKYSYCKKKKRRIEEISSGPNITDAEISEANSPIKFQRTSTPNAGCKLKSIEGKSQIFDIKLLQSAFKADNKVETIAKKLNLSFSNIASDFSVKTPKAVKNFSKNKKDSNIFKEQSLQLCDVLQNISPLLKNANNNNDCVKYISPNISPVISQTVGNSQHKIIFESSSECENSFHSEKENDESSAKCAPKTRIFSKSKNDFNILKEQSWQVCHFRQNISPQLKNASNSYNYCGKHISPNISPVISGNTDDSQCKIISEISPECEKSFHSEKESNGFESYEDMALKKPKKNNDKRFHLSSLNSTLGGKSDLVKGSDWLTTIQVLPKLRSKAEVSDLDDFAGIKKLRNLLPGGLAEQVQNLQIKERSARVIWNHHKDSLKQKSSSSSLHLKICAVQSLGDLVVTRCVTQDSEECNNKKCDKTLNSSSFDIENATQFIVFFRRNMFEKLGLQTRHHFRLYPPWQKLVVPHLLHPVIFCTYYVEVLNNQEQANESCSILTDVDSLDNLKHLKRQNLSLADSLCTTTHLLADKTIPQTYLLQKIHNSSGSSFSLTGRVQRIWWCSLTRNFLNESVSPYTRYAFLLQTKEGIFYELVLPSISTTTRFWTKIISSGEGKCFTFHNVTLTNRFDKESNHSLFFILDNIRKAQQNQKMVVKHSRFCYQITAEDTCRAINYSSDEDFVSYYSFKFTPLIHIKLVTAENSRVNCIGKVICEINNMYYISDESLVKSTTKYMVFMFTHWSIKPNEQILDSVVIIREAVFQNGILQIDKFCNFIVLNNTTITVPNYCNNVSKGRLASLSAIKLINIALQFDLGCQVMDVVLVKGKISDVNQEKSVSWLECNICHKENLLQIEGNSKIYCEDCKKMVPDPVLNVKLEVIIIIEELPEAVLYVELAASTTKQILRMDNTTYQPEFSVSDVLEKDIGPIWCYIKAFGETKGKHFHLVEIQDKI